MTSKTSGSAQKSGIDDWADFYWHRYQTRSQDAAYFLRQAECIRTEPSSLARVLRAAIESFGKHLGQSPYPEQIASALALRRGMIVEMATGEGKTLTLALTAALSLARPSGVSSDTKPLHILTANEYLAERDAVQMRNFYAELGLSCGFVSGAMSASERQANYRADVVYTTAKELLADYLRDQIAEAHPGGRGVLRGLHFVLVDEADHLLIDEASTPLLISKQVAADQRLVSFYQGVFQQLRHAQQDREYTVDSALQTVQVPPKLVASVAAAFNNHGGFYQNVNWLATSIKRTLEVRHFLLRDQHYLVSDQGIQLIDEGTGRVMPNRSFGQGRHTMVEIKEGLAPSPHQQIVRSCSFQRFFRQIPVLGGVTGTASENRREFWQVYRQAILPMPTHRPTIRQILPLQVFAREHEKWQRVAEIARDTTESGRALLIGTGSVSDSHACARALRTQGLSFGLINAAMQEEEAELVAQAGQPRRITIATNMAGRGTDIPLHPAVKARGGLCVISSHWQASERFDRQLFGRCGRQGDPGRAMQIISLDDEVIRRFSSRWKVSIGQILLKFGLRPLGVFRFDQTRAGCG